MAEQKGNIKFPVKATLAELYGPAMKIRDPEEAKDYFKALVDYQLAFGVSQEKAEQIQRANLGYYAGYYDKETRLRVEKLFNCAHPVFGSATNGVPTAKEALEAGKSLAEAKPSPRSSCKP